MSAPEPLHEEYFGHRHKTVIQPRTGTLADLREVWAYRELLWTFALRDLQVRYKQAALGVVWIGLRPLIMLSVMCLFFGLIVRLPSDGYPYPIFVFSAMVPWLFFSQALSGSGASVVGAAGMVGKVYFPRLVIPLASVLARTVDLFVSVGILLLLMLIYGITPSLNLLAFPALLIATLFTAIGSGVLIAALSVSFRDVRELTPLLVQLWMYATPIIYPSSLVPEAWRPLYFLNPMAGLIEGYRCAFLGRDFDFQALAYSGAVAVVLMFIGIRYFLSVERRFADVI
jgi:lipopolysaccharide transport system permease protein